MLETMGVRARLSVACGLLLVLAGVLLASNWASMFSNFLSTQMAVSQQSLRFANWQRTPIPMYIDVYFHNWTNPKDIKTHKPVFTQMGPYRFREVRTKVDLIWNTNKTVSYRQVRHWYFDQKNSAGSLKDLVTTVNAVALTVAYKSRFQGFFDQKAISYGLIAFRQKLEVVKTVEELLFKGYKDDLMTFAHNLPDVFRRGEKTPDKFGWFYQRNGTSEQDGLVNMATGEGDLARVGQILAWNGAPYSPYFQGDCARLQGTTGEIFPPALNASHVHIFSPDLCRSVKLGVSKKVEMLGVEGLEFDGGAGLFDSGHVDPANQCFCEPECTVPRGLSNVTACKFGVPIFISYPHFLHADPALRHQVAGMQPHTDKHNFLLTVEPTFGIPMEVKARFQLNLMLEPMETYRIFSDIPRRFFMPVMWFDQRAFITEQHKWQIKLLLWGPSAGVWLGALMALSGALLGLYSAAQLVLTTGKTRNLPAC